MGYSTTVTNARKFSGNNRRPRVEVASMTDEDAVPEMPTTGDTYLRRVWWEVRDKDGIGAEYDTGHQAIDAYHNWWNVEWPQHAPYRVVRCEVHETEVDPIGMEVDNEP